MHGIKGQSNELTDIIDSLQFIHMCSNSRK